MTKLALIAIALSFSATSYATDWYISTFTMNGTHADLVQLTRAPAFTIKGKAVISQDFYTGHLVLNNNPYPCRSVGAGALTPAGEAEIICNMDTEVFADMLETEGEKKEAYLEAVNVLGAWFSAHKGIEYITIPVGFVIPTEEKASFFKRTFLEPTNRQAQLETDYSASGVTEF